MNEKTLNDILDLITSNTTSPDEMETIREEVNHHLIDQIYKNDILKELSDSYDDPVCPHCGKKNIIRYGKDKYGKQRFLCKDCHKTFSPITGTLFAYSKKKPYQWYQYLSSLLRGDTIDEAAQRVGICLYTSFVWRHKILSICDALTSHDQALDGVVYLDEKLANVCYPGIIEDQTEPKIRKKGISDQKRNIACAIDEHNRKIIQVSERGRIHTETLYNIYKDKIPSSCTVVSDSLRSYHGLMKRLGVTWIKIPSGKKEKDGYTLDKVNQLHSSIELFMHKYRGISDKYLKHYIGLFKLKDRNKKYYLKTIFVTLYKRIMNSKCVLRFTNITDESIYGLD